MKKVLIPIRVCMILILLTGCWNRRELNDLAINSALGIDKSGDQYLLSAQVINPGQISPGRGGGGGNYAPVTTYRTKEMTIFNALRKMSRQTPRKLYQGHMRMLIIGEDVAREGIAEVVDFIERDHEFRSNFFIVVAKGTRAEKILSTLTHIEKNPAEKMFRSLEMSAKAWAPTVEVRLDQLVSELISPGKNPVLTAIQLNGDIEEGMTVDKLESVPPPSILQYGGSAVFKKDVLVGWFNENESKGYNYAMGNVRSTTGFVRDPRGGKILGEVIRTKARIETRVQNGNPKGSVFVEVTANIGEAMGNIDITDPKTIDWFENESEEKIGSLIQSSIAKAKKWKTDVFGFGEALQRSNPDYWAGVEKDWDQTFAKLPVEVQVDFRIKQIGTANQPILKRLKE
ncbi:Ger(x)C family spore germination protein [Lihuaxuella thermophila]|uniref:Spore germination protein KC n=1 Tax=Lihuaxuella thermophila TaxID=1173111 RepID=A0A1H8EVU6_9BACL|nr:Ger(x)C family spore germination protein [Lihuaxuella thermophila]SEN23595.1 spore germination protein KC [Lihuaxuella thermophila]